jgi:DNA primase
MPDFVKGVNAQVIDDCIQVVKSVPKLKAIEQMGQEQLRVEREGDIMRAAQIASQIITLKSQLKGSL